MPAPSFTFAERFAIVSLLGQSFTAIGTFAYVETRPPEERAAARRERYATLARTVVTASTLTAVWLSFDEMDGRR